MSDLTIKRLGLDEMDEASTIHRTAFDERMPWLAGFHTPVEDRYYFREQLFQKCKVFGALEDARLVGIIAFREGWIDQLYVRPSAQGRGIGTALLDIAKSTFSPLELLDIPAQHSGSPVLRDSRFRADYGNGWRGKRRERARCPLPLDTGLGSVPPRRVGRYSPAQGRF